MAMMAPPSRLTLAMSMLRSRMQAMDCAAKAFVQLEDVDVVDGEAGALQRFASQRPGRSPMISGAQPAVGRCGSSPVAEGP